MKLRSLRTRLLLLAAATLVAALTIAGASLVLIFERHIERRVEQELRTRLTELAAAVAITERGKPEVRRVLSDPRYTQPYSGSYWQISDEIGPIVRSRSLWEEQLPFGDPATAGPEAMAFEAAGFGRTRLYILQRDVTLEEGDTLQRYRLSVALDHADIAELGASFRSDVTLALSVIAAVLFMGAWLQTSFGLRPLRHLRNQLGAVRIGEAKRLDNGLPDEVKPLVDELNLLIDKQEETVAKARKRASDLAHGLKTPLTILTGEARRLDGMGVAGSASTLREQVDLMRTHVERELARARTHGVSGGIGILTDVAPTVQRLVDLMRRMPRGETLNWNIQVDRDLKLIMDPADFGEVLGNVLDNARKWAVSNVTVSAMRERDSARLLVSDDGPGISAQARTRVIQRGEQGAYDSEGSGLGLAIANDVLSEYGTQLILADAVAGGCSASFVIRAVDAAQSTADEGQATNLRTAPRGGGLRLAGQGP
jgi:signal transduction histidine kinase